MTIRDRTIIDHFVGYTQTVQSDQMVLAIDRLKMVEQLLGFHTLVMLLSVALSILVQILVLIMLNMAQL